MNKFCKKFSDSTDPQGFLTKDKENENVMDSKQPVHTSKYEQKPA